MTTPTDTPRASVVVATYNRPAMLVRLLRSLAVQDCRTPFFTGP